MSSPDFSKYSPEKLNAAINKLYIHFFWLSDFEEALKIIKEIDEEHLEALVKTSDKFKRILRELREESKKLKKEERKRWVTEEIAKKYPVKEGLALGNLAIHLLNIIDMIKRLLKAKVEGPKIIRKESYKYLVIGRYSGYEIRAFLYFMPSMENISNLMEYMEESGFSSETVDKSEKTIHLQFFSNSSFIDLVLHQDILLMSVSMKKPTEEYVRKITEEILDVLTKH